MAGKKNLLADTDYTKGHDNRFQNAVSVGFVSKVEVNGTQANVRVIYPDRVDHKGQPLITKPIPVLQVASQAKKSFAVPRVGDMVAVQKLANGTSNYLVTGSFYTTANPPPVTDPMLDYTLYDDGSTKQFNAADGTETWDLKGGISIKTAKAIVIEATAEGITVKALAGTVRIEGDQVQLVGNSGITFQGNITHTGNMTTSGTHTDSAGHHTSAADLERRLAELEERVRILETNVRAVQ
jgi:phage baseplate assembly protein V